MLFSFKAQINKLFCFYCAVSDGQALILLEKWKSETQGPSFASTAAMSLSVIIQGASLAGLATARSLAQNKRVKVTVLEKTSSEGWKDAVRQGHTGLWTDAMCVLRDQDAGSFQELLKGINCGFVHDSGYRNTNGEWLIKPLRGVSAFDSLFRRDVKCCRGGVGRSGRPGTRHRPGDAGKTSSGERDSAPYPQIFDSHEIKNRSVAGA